MHIITEPTVHLIAATHFYGHPVYKIPNDGTHAEKLGAFAAKGCYDSFGGSGRPNTENQRRVIREKHGSVLEHAHATFFVEGITRAVSLEINRHRHLGISQRSTRYTAEEDGAIVLEPWFAGIWNKFESEQLKNTWRIGRPRSACSDSEWEELLLLEQHIERSKDAFAAYTEQVEKLVELNPLGKSGFDLRKWARGKARNLLPHNAETRATYTVNYRGFRHFLEARSSRHAEPEVRLVANKMLEQIRPLAPSYFEDYEPFEVDGIVEWSTEFTKV